MNAGTIIDIFLIAVAVTLTTLISTKRISDDGTGVLGDAILTSILSILRDSARR